MVLYSPSQIPVSTSFFVFTYNVFVVQYLYLYCILSHQLCVCAKMNLNLVYVKFELSSRTTIMHDLFYVMGHEYGPILSCKLLALPVLGFMG
jgi:hypothetical protein